MVQNILLYIGDPMCSWCYGFGAVISRLKEEFAEDFEFQFLMGGLRPGKMAETMTQKTKEMIEHHWHEVHERTGEPFSLEFFERTDFLYDTEPSCRAVVTMRHLNEAVAFDYFRALQKGFYAENKDITKEETLVELALPFGIDKTEFLPKFNHQDTIDETYNDFRVSHELGIAGFPAVLFGRHEDLFVLTRGYQAYENLVSPLRAYLVDQAEK